MEKPARAFGYVTISDVEQRVSPEAAAAHVAALIRYADENGLDLGPPRQAAVHDRVFDSRERIIVEVCDPDVRFFERPRGRALSEAWRQGDHLLISGVDRLGRRVAGSADVLEAIERTVSVHVVGFGGWSFLLASAAGLMFRHTFTLCGQSEVRRNRERGMRKHAQARLSGRPATRYAPAGFRWEGHGRFRQMVVDHRQIALMRRALAWIDAGWTRRQIYRELVRLRVPVMDRSPADVARWGKGWGAKSVARLVTATKKMRSMLLDADGLPDDGGEWIEQLIREADARLMAKEAGRRQREAAAAEKRSRKLLVSG